MKRVLLPSQAAPGGPQLPWKERFHAIRYVPRLLSLAWQSQPMLASLILAVRLANAALPIALLWIAKLIIDRIIANAGVPDPDWPTLVALVSLELGVAILYEALGRLTGVLETHFGDIVTKRMSLLLMGQALRMDLAQFEDPDFLDRLQRATRQSQSQLTFLSTILSVVQSLGTLATILIAVAFYSPWLLCILILAAVPSLCGQVAYGAAAYSFMSQWTERRRELDYYRWLTADLRAAKEVRLLGLNEYILGEFETRVEALMAANRELSTSRAMNGAVLQTCPTLAYYAAVLIVALHAVEGGITIGTFTFLVGSFSRGQRYLTSISTAVTRFFERSLQLRDFFTLLDADPSVVSRDCAVPLRHIGKGLEVQDVGFRYPGSHEWALRRIRLSIRPGETIALVGSNGAGKTTLVKLLTRLYDPTEGRILIDGRDVREFDVASLRRALSVVFQDFVRYDLTARANIGIGSVQSREDLSRIRRAAEESTAAGVIEGLPLGYDQMLGKRFSGGVNLSGGEWQKIALARGYMRDAAVLILDEPTASLDPRAELETFRRLRRRSGDGIVILISHRFSTVRCADRIVVLEGGSIAEMGSHEELMASEAGYASLFRMQAQHYS